MNSGKLKELLVNPKFWGAVVGLLTTLGISYFKNVDPNVLVGAIITITTVFIGGSAYENGKKELAEAHAHAANVAAEAVKAAQMRGVAPQDAPLPADAAYKNLAPYMTHAPRE